MAKKGFYWFDQPAEGTMGKEGYEPARQGFLSQLGSGLQGFAAGYLDPVEAYKANVGQEQNQAQAMFQNWLAMQQLQLKQQQQNLENRSVTTAVRGELSSLTDKYSKYLKGNKGNNWQPQLDKIGEEFRKDENFQQMAEDLASVSGLSVEEAGAQLVSDLQKNVVNKHTKILQSKERMDTSGVPQIMKGGAQMGAGMFFPPAYLWGAQNVGEGFNKLNAATGYWDKLKQFLNK